MEGNYGGLQNRQIYLKSFVLGGFEVDHLAAKTIRRVEHP
jgi:hypothetical protein